MTFTPEEVIEMAKEAGFGMQMALLDHPYCQADAQRLYQQLSRLADIASVKTVQRIAVNCAKRDVRFDLKLK